MNMDQLIALSISKGIVDKGDRNKKVLCMVRIYTTYNSSISRLFFVTLKDNIFIVRPLVCCLILWNSQKHV